MSIKFIRNHHVLVMGLSLFAMIALTGCSQPAINQKTIQSCAALLPKGDLYLIEIRGTIDTGTTPSTLEGAFEIFAEGADSDSMTQFSECMRSIIQPASINKGPEIATDRKE